MKMDDYMGTANPNGSAILGKFMAYSLNGAMIRREKLIEIGKLFGLRKVKPARDSKKDAFRNATSRLNERRVFQSGDSVVIQKIFCRDNKRSDGNMSRELLLETLDHRTNPYEKLCNICFDVEHESLSFEDIHYYPGIDVDGYCAKARELFDLYSDCYGSSHIDTVVKDVLEEMMAVKIPVWGNDYFIPADHISRLDVLEDYLATIQEWNLNDEVPIIVHSFYLVNSEKQRKQMLGDFYLEYQKTIKDYQERLQTFLANGVKGKAVIDRWLQKIDNLLKKKQLYESTFQQEFQDFNNSLSILQLQAQELQVRSLSIPDANKTAA